MNNAVISRSSTPSPWRGRSPGFFEFNTVVNLLDDPIILIDLQRGMVLSANSHILKLTAFTLAEIISLPLVDLLPQLPRQEIKPGETFETLLNRRNRDAILTIARPIALDGNNQWYLLNLVPLSTYQQNQMGQQIQEIMLEALLDLATLYNQSDLQSSLDMAMQVGARLFGVNILSIFKAGTDFPELQKIASSPSAENDLLPDIIASGNLMRMQAPTLWLPGRRVATELQKTARIANLSFLVTVPLGKEGAWLGLLVAGDTHAPPPEKIIPLMELLAANITSALDHYILVANLERSILRKDREQTFQTVIADNAGEGVILLNPDLTIRQMNPTAELMLGYASQEVFGQPVDSILIGTETIAAALKSALQGIPTHNLGNINLHRRSGQAFSAHVQTLPVRNGDEFLGIAILLADVSENEQIRVRTQQLEQRAVLGEVTAIFAHEVRNPINNISTGLQLMAMKLPADDPNQELIGRLQHDCSRLLHLMESVLSFSRPMEYRLEPTDLGMIIKRLIERWGPRMARVGITPFIQADPACPLVLADGRALEQVLTNLVSNAVQAMSSSGGTLAIKVNRSPGANGMDQVEVTVSDSGPGIPDEIRDHIFEPFVTTNPQGTGLGLAITKRIITAHKGNISVNSFPGGTVFTVNIPVMEEVH